MNIRVGFGFDVHQLKEGLDFWLGGIIVPHTKGGLGHSDADVLIHTICDALLGAANLGDIGQFFPSNEKKWKGMDSTHFLSTTIKKVLSVGYKLEHVDTVVILQKPENLRLGLRVATLFYLRT